MNGILSQSTDYKKFFLPLLLLLISFLFMPPQVKAGGSNGDDVLIVCPNDITMEAAPGLCGVVFDFNTLVWFSTVPLVDTIFNPGPGSFFFIGTTPVTLMGTDTNGMVSVCAFDHHH